jgi:hypothetical protein
VKRCVVIALLTALFCSPPPVVWAAPFENADIAKALIAPPNVPQESEELVRSFLDHTLPHLLADDARLAHQLGLGDSMSNPILIDRALPIMLIRRDDVMKLLAGKAKPLDLVNNTNNWMKDKADRLIPIRIVFSLKMNNSTPDAETYSWSSVTMEQSREGSWRIIQVGAPKLSRAMRKYEDPHANHFLLWIPDLNRHYLGQISATDHSIILTKLFNDRLTHREPGTPFEVTEKFLKDLMKLYEDLDLPKKSRDQSYQTQLPSQTR